VQRGSKIRLFVGQIAAFSRGKAIKKWAKEKRASRIARWLLVVIEGSRR
jgi:hypothetical protein